MKLLSRELIEQTNEYMSHCINPKDIDFQNPFFTQPKHLVRTGDADLRRDLAGQRIDHLYLHVPFCMSRCVYCHYPIVQPGTEAPDIHKQFVSTVLSEIDYWAVSELDFSQLKTIALGGGTPNALSHEHLQKILEKLHEQFPIRTEVSVEVLPSFAILDEAKYKMFRSLGVNRLSVGIQTFNDEINKANRRYYQKEAEARALVNLAHEYFPNISVDLLYRQKAQEWDDLVSDIEKAKELDAHSVYLYQVREHIGTRFSDLQVALNYFLVQMLSDKKYEAVSFDQVIKRRNAEGFCKARHGRSQCENLLGIGPSSVSEIAHLTWRNVDMPAYAASGFAIEPKTVINRSEERLQAEWISRGFRHFNSPDIDGISFVQFRKRFGCDPGPKLREKLTYLECGGLITLAPDHALLTDLGMLFTQAISGHLIGHYK
jgi:oxygen-independent coproporphyrinogen-3 oxidase